MAKNGRFKPSWSGYRQVLQGDDVMQALEGKAAILAGRATAISGHAYTIDSVVGLTRIHTRITTLETWPSRMNEIRTHALASQAQGKYGLGSTLIWRGGSWRDTTIGKRVKRGGGGLRNYRKTHF